MKKVSFLVICFTICLFSKLTAFAETIGVIGDDVEAYAGSGSENDPLHYLFDANSKVTWKHLCDVRDAGLTEIYENREDGTPQGKLIYAWSFTGKDITTPEGPYFLGINFYSNSSVSKLPGDSGAMYFSFVCKRDLPGCAVITMYVGNQFEDNTKLELYYYGGYNSIVVHASTPVIDNEEIFEIDKLKQIAKGLSVSDGYVKYLLRYGGNYILTEGLPTETEAAPSNGEISDDSGLSKIGADISMPAKKKAAKRSNSIRKNTATQDTSAKETENETSADEVGKPQRLQNNETEILIIPKGEENNVTVYQEETELGSIEELFPTSAIAQAIAKELRKQVSDEITQADLNSIKRLYLSGKELKNIDELGRVNFERLESLELSKNSIAVLPVLNMPMLSYIDLSENCITNATVLTKLKKLEVIILRDNKLKELPDICQLPSLKSIDAGNNLITKLNELNSSTLVYLDISKNRITEIAGLQGLPSLEYIDITENILDKLPDFTVCDWLTTILAEKASDSKKQRQYLWVTILIAVISMASAITFAIIKIRLTRNSSNK